MDDSYENFEGRMIFTSAFFRKRGICCKANCLHCPYGTTLRNVGVVISNDNQTLIQQLITELSSKSSTVDSLLAGAFGKQTEYAESDAYLLTLKDIPCGIAYFNAGEILKVFLKREFQDQNITDEYLLEVFMSEQIKG